MVRRLWRVVFSGVLIIAGGGLLYTTTKSVLEIKRRSVDETDGETISAVSVGDVVGLPGIPIYPGSEFMFQDDIKDPLVQSFLAGGESAYILPIDTSWETVATFYEKKLAERGWEHVVSVSSTDKEKVQGEYWVFSSGDPAQDLQTGTESETESTEIPIDIGVRIYSGISGVWYEIITSTQARNGLSDRIEQDKEIELLLALGSMQELPDTFPWKLSFPEVWDVEIHKSQLLDAPSAEFSSITYEGRVSIEPIAFDAGVSLSDVASEYLDSVNSYRDEDRSLSVVQEREVTIAKQDAVSFSLDVDGVQVAMAVVTQPKTGIVYAITSFDGEDAFFLYVTENLSVR